VATQLRAGVGRLLGTRSSPRWQTATHWSAYQAYLESLESRLADIDLPGIGAVRLDEMFVPLQLLRWSEDASLDRFTSGSDAPTIALDEALSARKHVLLIGPKGTGKSALLRWHAISAARAASERGRLGTFGDGAPPALPIYIALSQPSRDGDLVALAVAELRRGGFAEPEGFLEAHLAAGRATLILDDLDTFPHDERRAMAASLARFVADHPDVRVVLATRDAADAAWLDGFAIYEIDGIDAARVEVLTGRWGYGALANASGFLQVIERFPLARSLVSRPGWLAACLAVVSGQRLRAFDLVSGFVRFADPAVEPAWSEIALALHEQHTATGDREQLQPQMRRSGLLVWPTEDRFAFIHPVVQAFFAAQALAQRSDAASAIAERTADPWWDAVAILAIGHLDQGAAIDLCQRLGDADRLSLQALALAEVESPEPAIVHRTIRALLDTMGRGDEVDDRQAAIGVASLTGGEPVRRTGRIGPCLWVLEHGPEDTRSPAAAALGRMADPAAIAPLLTSLGDPRPDVRDAVADALAAFGDRTLQPLVRQLTVPNENVRQAAIKALARQGGRAVPALAAQLDSSSATARAEAADAMAAIGAPAVRSLIGLLFSPGTRGEDKERLDSRHAAVARALTKIGRPVVPVLVPVVATGDPSQRRSVIAILQAIGEDAVPALGEVVADERNAHSAEAASLLGELVEEGAAAAPLLVAALADDRFEVRWEARRGLRRFEGVALDALTAVLNLPDARVQWEAAQILLTMPNPPLDHLVPVLSARLGVADVNERRQAVRALGELPGAAGVAPLLIRALEDEDAAVRRAAIAQLGGSDDRRAADALAIRWHHEADREARLAILDAVSAIGPHVAVPVLIDALTVEDKSLRATAAELLGEAGEQAVVPLIEALNHRPAELDLEGALRVLERTSVAARAGGHAPANLARAYHRMLVEPLDVDELVYLTTTIEWWPPALELHRTFTTVKQFIEQRTLGGIGAAEAALGWMDEMDDWLRPAAQRALRQVRLISQAVQYYNRSGTRSAKEKGLLTATARLNELRGMVGDLGEPHVRVFHALVEHWSDLVNQAIRELQGRADIELELRSEHVRIRDVEMAAAVLVFEVVNRGEGLASNVQLALAVPADDLELHSAPTHYLPPLGHGDRMSTEFTVHRRGAGTVPISVEVRYDDPQQEAQTRRFAREVRFFVEETEYKEIGKSPYIAGPPVKSREMFYGRQSTFSWVQENLSGTYQDNVLVLYGERRTGKTSVLYQLQHHLPDTYAFVLIDLQTIAYALGSTGDLLFAMARKTTTGLRRTGFELEVPDREQYLAHPLECFEELGEAIGLQSRASGRRAVLIVDEFDLLIEAVENGQVTPYVFDCIRGLMQHQDGLSFIFTGAGKVSEMLKNPQSILFNTALRRKVSFLERDEAERLIREPVADVLWHDDLAIEKILRVTAGHPYFIQYICHEIVNIARSERKNFVTLRDVDRALQTTVQETTGIIRHAYMSLGIQERLVLAAIARITDDGRPFVSLDDVLETLRQDEFQIVKRDAFEVVRTLLERDFITERGADGTARQFGFTMDLVRVWIEQNDEYTRLLEEIRHE